METKKEINNRRFKEIDEIISTPEGRISFIEKDMRLPMFKKKKKNENRNRIVTKSSISAIFPQDKSQICMKIIGGKNGI